MKSTGPLPSTATLRVVEILEIEKDVHAHVVTDNPDIHDEFWVCVHDDGELYFSTPEDATLVSVGSARDLISLLTTLAEKAEGGGE